MKYYLKLLALPLSFLILFVSLVVVWEIANLPSTEELTGIVKNWFDEYGLPAVFLSSIIEGVLLVGGYFPGVFVIFLGVILSDSAGQATAVVFTATVGLFIAHLFNYALGKYGWYQLLARFGLKNSIEEARERLLKRGPLAIFSSYWLPSVAALTDTAAGIIYMPLGTFSKFSLFSVIFWDVLVGVIVYLLGDRALSLVSSDSSGLFAILVVVIVWIAILLVMDYFQKKKNN